MTIKKLGISLLILGSTIALASCSSKEQETATDKPTGETSQVLRVVEMSELPTMDLSQATDVVSFSAISQVMEGLYEFADNSSSQPAIAKEVVKPTNDGKKYTIALKENATWSNGEPVTAHDFVYSWQRTVDPKTASEYAYLFDGFLNYSEVVTGKKNPSELGVKALDDFTLEINLEYPIPYLSSILAKPTFYPQNQKFVEEKGDQYGMDSDSVLSNGPFELAEWDGTGMTWKYLKNDSYYQADKVKLDEIAVQVVKENGTSLNLYNSDEVEVIQVKGEFAQQESANQDLVLREYPGNYYIQYNFENAIFANKEARLAISKVIDSQQIASNILGDGSKELYGFVPSGIINPETEEDFSEKSGKLLTPDIEAGKAHWEKAKAELQLEQAEVTLLASDTDSAKKLAEYVQGVLTSELAGLKVNVSTVPFNNRLDAMSKGNFDFVLAGWAATYADPYDFLQLVNAGTTQNYGKWDNAEYTALLKTAATTYVNDNQKRWETLLEAHKLLIDNAPVTPLYQSSESYLVKEEVKGLVYRALGSPYYKNVSIEK
ncbi:peptide ABC transporter substrate-binding protein [Vagococcus salmoninarum]|uniref:peptide ABC transporter substrate-binding protein n=2 Tax=Vagococcus salmoninarum TaxID=2739 RepID=UPI00187F2477|nr:peptide ABC transporter substrate-binding protein [Vagococcus salmoninarum]MBE9388533.1 peptide ABC transporter substrate-binding protein [Vagococcus salmoninarum]